MHSMRSPIKITMVGNNGKQFSFLVKFGEDLRHDQRIEQLLLVMNNTLSENVYCCKKQISILTYIVSYLWHFTIIVIYSETIL